MATMPCAANSTGVNQLIPLLPFRETASWEAQSIGLPHQVVMRLSSPAVTMAASPMKPSFTASHRVRVMESRFQASRKVPASSSRVTSGAPQNAPMVAGATSSTATVPSGPR